MFVCLFVCSFVRVAWGEAKKSTQRSKIQNLPKSAKIRQNPPKSAKTRQNLPKSYYQIEFQVLGAEIPHCILMNLYSAVLIYFPKLLMLGSVSFMSVYPEKVCHKTGLHPQLIQLDAACCLAAFTPRLSVCSRPT